MTLLEGGVNLKYKKIIIGIDQSYKNTGISVAADKQLKKVHSVQLEHLKDNSSKRKKLKESLNRIIARLIPQAECVEVIIERIRLRSQGFLNINYIKSIGALNATIVDVCNEYGIKVSSVDTRCWKSQVIGTSKEMTNKYGVPEKKWPTVQWVIKQGFESSLLIKVESRKTKGTFLDKSGVRWMYNNDAADSAGIAMFGFLGDKGKLQEEK